jgi:anaerobic magnesium-protoporphyrin IX monomethyl ester cyclase
MKTLLVNPPFLKNYSRQSRSPCVAKSGTVYFSYYLAYAGCALESAGHSVEYLDAIADDLTFEESLKIAVNANPSLVILDTSTPSILADIQFASELKNRLPEITIGCVGTFPSKATEEFFKLAKEAGGSIDLGFRGEYEETVVEVADALKFHHSLDSIQGIAYIDKQSGKLIKNGDLRKTTEATLDKLPHVSEFYLRHLGEDGIKRHFYASIQWPYIQILTARGCPYKCSFCNIPSIGSYRTRSIDSVIDEFKFIEKHLPFVKEVFIEDDTFPINKKRVKEFCEKYIENKINLTWSCNARVNTDKETLQLMRKAGCRLTCVGFESPNPKALDLTLKKTNLSQQEKYMSDASEAGIKVNGCFILGLHGDTRESIQSTIDYSIKLSPNTVQFYPHMLYPGTESFQWAEANDLLEHKDWGKWLTKEGFHNTPLRLNGLKSQDLLDLADGARLQFYTHPRYIIRMLKQSLSSFGELQRMFIAGKSFFPELIKYIFRSFSQRFFSKPNNS